MKQSMIDMMLMMMPFMRPIALAGGAFALIDLLLSAYVCSSGNGRGLWSLFAKLTFASGLFFIACEIAGRFLGMEPTILFASDPIDRSLYWNQWPFWMIGAALILTWMVAKLMCARLRSHSAA